MIIDKPKKKKKMSRYTVMRIIAGGIIGIFVLRLLYLQVFCYEEYKEKANTTSTKFVSETAPRGEILDSNGILLATNKRTYSLTYTETKEVKEKFYETMTELFKILDEGNESIPDKMLLRLNDDNDDDESMYFAFNTTDESGHKFEELRFKKDRGFDDDIKKKLYPDVTSLTPEQSEKIDEELLKITPEDVFYKLVKNYDLISLAEPNYKKDDKKKKLYPDLTGQELTQKILDAGYSMQDIKRYMVVKDIIKIQNLKGNNTVTIVNNISKDMTLTVKQRLTDLPGIDVASVPIRNYPYKNLASSILGYVSPITSAQESQYELRGYDISSDLVGVSGIESTFEDQLKGIKGGTTVKVNSSGRLTEKLFELQAYPGNNINLTIDAGLQWASEQALKDTITNIRENKTDSEGHRYKNATRGALVTVDVKSGKILSLVSYPDYDPNLFAVPGTLTQEESDKYFNPDYKKFGEELIQKFGLKKTVDELFKDGKDSNGLYASPFYNYATMSSIPPGSTFKPLTGIAGLENGVIGPNEYVRGTTTKFDMHPELFNSQNAPKCLAAHGDVDIRRALEVSCNIYFYELAYRMYHQARDRGETEAEALNSIAKYAWQFGLGSAPNTKGSTGIEIAENFGQAYNFEYSKEQSIYYAKYELVDYLEKGDYKGVGLTFVPFDIQANEEDIDEVKNSKKKIKDLVDSALEKVGTDEKVDENEFMQNIKKEVKNIMNYSDEYKSRVSNYENKTNKTVNLEKEADQVTEAIRRFAINDKPSEIATPAQIIYASIGQGMNNFSPLQLAQYVSTIANGGTRYKLHLVDKITNAEGNVLQQFDSKVLNTINMKPENIAAIKDGMSRVNNDEGGTAAAQFVNFPIKTGGKTGTADAKNNDEQYEVGRAPYATYISFAPLEDPEIAVVAVVFDGGHGGFAAQAVRGVYDYYFRERLLADNPNYPNVSEAYRKYVIENPILNRDGNDDKFKDLIRNYDVAKQNSGNQKNTVNEQNTINKQNNINNQNNVKKNNNTNAQSNINEQSNPNPQNNVNEQNNIENQNNANVQKNENNPNNQNNNANKQNNNVNTPNNAGEQNNNNVQNNANKENNTNTNVNSNEQQNNKNKQDNSNEPKNANPQGDAKPKNKNNQ